MLDQVPYPNPPLGGVGGNGGRFLPAPSFLSEAVPATDCHNRLPYWSHD